MGSKQAEIAQSLIKHSFSTELLWQNIKLHGNIYSYLLAKAIKKGMMKIVKDEGGMDP